MKRITALLATLAASCSGHVYAETAYKQVTCVTIAQAHALLRKHSAKPVLTFTTENGHALIVEAGDDMIVLEFLPADNMACLILDGKKLKGA
jgi:hypothetical protein